MKPGDVLLSDVQGQIGTLMVNRPEKRNALSPELLAKMHMLLQQWAREDTVRVVVITGGSGKAFSAGYDISAIPTEINPELMEMFKHNNPLKLAMDSMASFPYPTIAMLNGYAYGAGLNLAICCDMRIAADDISVAMPPAKLGLVYHPEGIQQFINVVGMARTREIFLTGRTMRGLELIDMGLVNRLVPASQLHATTYALAQEIAANAPLSLKGTKRIIDMFRQEGVLSESQFREAEVLINTAFTSHDLAEGQMAFFEKRKPVFLGR